MCCKQYSLETSSYSCFKRIIILDCIASETVKQFTLVDLIGVLFCFWTFMVSFLCFHCSLVLSWLFLYFLHNLISQTYSYGNSQRFVFVRKGIYHRLQQSSNNMVLRVLITIFPVILLFFCFCSLKNNTTLLDPYVERIPKINLTKFLRSSHIILERHVCIYFSTYI